MNRNQWRIWGHTIGDATRRIRIRIVKRWSVSKHRGSGCVISRSSNSLTDHKAVPLSTVSLPCAVCTTLPMHPRMLRWNGSATLHMKSVARTSRQTITSCRCNACSCHNGSPGHKLVSRAETSECHGGYSRGCCRHSHAG